MVQLLDLCSPTGAVTILPTVLHLVTSIMKETCARGAITPAPSIVRSCVNVFTIVCDHQLTGDEDSEELASARKDWDRLLQSTMASILQYAHPGGDHSGTDLAVLVSMLSVFTCHCPKEVTSIPSLLTPVLDIYSQAWDSTVSMTRLKCVEALNSILTHEDPSVPIPYIHTLAPRIIEHLNTSASSLSTNSGRSQTDLQLLYAELDALQRLLSFAQDDRRVTMMAMYVPILVSMLLDETTSLKANVDTRRLNDLALDRLTEVGRLYPEHFRNVMAMSTNLRPRLEAAVKLRQQTQAQVKARAAAQVAQQPAKPTITLKMDFSNFKT